MLLRSIALLILAFVLPACTSLPPTYKPMTGEAQEKRDRMVGTWYGSRETDGGVLQWITTRLADSRMVVRFNRPSEAGDTRQVTTEVGIWGISGPVYFTMTRGWIDGEEFSPVNPMNANYYDAYEILNLDEDVFRYRSFEVGAEYEQRRVDDDFEFPVLDKPAD